MIGDLRDSNPGEAILLAAPPKRSHPQSGHVAPKRRERPAVGWDRKVAKMSGHDLPQPDPLAGDRPVHPSPQLYLDLLKLGSHAVAAGLPLKLEAPLA